ncbi:MAG: hypothetical protein O3B72_11925, partial [Proteobacteria bacterium]|nr:hypothetical protein [Pseudomonadota bacterium]
GNVKDLRHQLIQVLSGTSADARARLRRWSQCLGDQSGALFLEQILNHAAGTGPRPVSPWEAARQ